MKKKKKNMHIIFIPKSDLPIISTDVFAKKLMKILIYGKEITMIVSLRTMVV